MADILKQAKERFEACEEYYSSEYKRGRECEAFLYGDQWDEEARRSREGRPCLVENRLLPFKHQVLNSIKQADLSIQVSPVDDEADEDTAVILQGIIRNIEVQSNASSAYDTAADRAISGGYGYFRINTRYADEASFEQEAYIERILNPDSVYLDPGDMTMDGSTAEFGFVFDDMEEDEFKEKYPKASLDGFDKKCEGNWWGEKKVRVAEYFYKEYETKTIYLLSTGEVVDEKPELGVVDEREVRVPTVKWCKMTANEILEETTWLGKYIPIVPVYGEEAWLDGRRKIFSLTYQAQDPQRMLNYWVSADTELMALQPKAPYVGAIGSFDSKKGQWQSANVRNPAYLEYDPVITENGTMAPPPSREPPPMGSPGMADAIARHSLAIKATLGMFDASMGQHGNELISGRALKEGKLQGDNANFHFFDNLGISIAQGGRILVDLIPKLYSGPRMMRIIGRDGKKEIVPVNQPYAKTERGLVPLAKTDVPPDGFYDLGVGKYDVVVQVGANYATKRQETADTILQLGQVKPEILEVAGDILVKNLDIPDNDILVERIRAVMPPELLGDDPQAAKAQQAEQQIKDLNTQLISMQLELDKKISNQQFENELKLKELESENTQFEITARQKDRELEIKAMEATAKIKEAMPTATPEIIMEIANTLSEIIEENDDIKGAVEQIISAKESEATSQPRGILSRLMGRNS